jgi:regulatory protein
VEDYTKKDPVTPGELRLAGMDLLARREHGSAELKTKLTKRFRKRDCEPGLVEQVIQQLIEEGLLSDERFAASRVRQLAGRGYGPSRIRNDLRQQRVEHLISDTMEEAFDSEVDWEMEAAAVYEKKYGGAPIEGDWDARQRERGRRIRFMQYRGFGAEVSQKLVSEDDQGERSAENAE